MGLFGFGKKQGRSEQVWAYFEDALTFQCPCVLRGPLGTEVEAQLLELHEKEDAAEFKLLGPIFAKTGASVGLNFVLDGLRVGGDLKVLEAHPRSVKLSLPETLSLAERRSSSRCRIGTSEPSAFTALTGLYDGLGFLGPILNVGQGGVKVRISHGMAVKNQKPIHVTADMLQTGLRFVVVKLNKVPRCPVSMDLEGVLAYTEPVGRIFQIGIRFDPALGEYQDRLKDLAENRTGKLIETLPERERRRH